MQIIPKNKVIINTQFKHYYRMQLSKTYGNFILMKIQVVKNEIIINIKPIEISRILFILGVIGLCVLSSITNPSPPNVKNRLAANPSIIYCPLIQYFMKATGRECPYSSTVDPIEGGSTIISYIIPPQTKN